MIRKTAKYKENQYSAEEESWNIGTHAFGLFISTIGVIILLFNALQLHSLKIFVAFLIYGIGVITMFLASTLYHSSKDPKIRSRLNVFDHSAIYLTIAGSYTPISLLTLPGIWGIPVLITVWIIAATGITLKFFFIGKYRRLSTIMYVLMGWVILVAIKPLITSMETKGLIWLLTGGIAYSIGAILYQNKKLKFNHAIFHFFVLAGAACHYMVVYFYCLK